MQELLGSCMCGGVQYKLTGPLYRAAYCHCSMCRKAHGSAFRPRALVAAEHFHWLRGTELVTDYQSSPGVHRCFCSRCGSPLIAYAGDEPKVFNLTLGSIDGDPLIRPTEHWHVASKAPWYEITDTLPQYESFPLSANS
jgi:hypothetical protein